MELTGDEPLGRMWVDLFAKLVEPHLVQPTFVIEYPIEDSPLARRNEESPEVVDRFELYIFGREIANAFSELNDPLDQRERFREQLQSQERQGRRGRSWSMRISCGRWSMECLRPQVRESALTVWS